MSGFPGPSASALGVAEPALPPGPGVAPPFVAPPADRDRRRLWIGLAIGVVLLMTCCTSGVIGLGVLLVSTTDQAKRQAEIVVNAYLEAMEGGDPETAYDLLCRDYMANLSVDDIVEQIDAEAMTGYQLAEPQLIEAIEVAAQITYRDGEQRRFRFYVDVERTDYRICNIEER